MTVGPDSKWITVQDSQCLDPVSQITGSRRHSFPIQGQLSLVLRCYTRRGRHDYVLHSRIPGPNAFVYCIADMAHSGIQIQDQIIDSRSLHCLIT